MRDVGQCCRFFLCLEVALTSAVLLSGCSPALIRMDRQDRARLTEQAEVYAVVYSPPLWQTDSSRVGASEIGAALFGAAGALLGAAIDLSRAKSEISAEQYLDTSPQVRDRFVQQAKIKLGLQNIRATDLGVPSESLKQYLGATTVFDFKVTEWELVTLNPQTWSGRYRVPTAMRARLVRLSDSRDLILWQGVCKFPSMGSDTEARREYTLLRGKAQREADRCADELIAQFLAE